MSSATDETLYQEIDKGIVHVVRLLRDNGFDTFMSCEGNEGQANDPPHSFLRPTIGLHMGKESYFAFRRRLIDFLHQHCGPCIATMNHTTFFGLKRPQNAMIVSEVYVTFKNEIRDWHPH